MKRRSSGRTRGHRTPATTMRCSREARRGYNAYAILEDRQETADRPRLQTQANFFGASGIENPQTSVLPADAFARSLTRNSHLERSA